MTGFTSNAQEVLFTSTQFAKNFGESTGQEKVFGFSGVMVEEMPFAFLQLFLIKIDYMKAEWQSDTF